MAKRLASFLAFITLGSSIALAAVGAFTIESVTYTDANGKQQTATFDAMNNKAQIPAVSVTNDIIIKGSYGPPNGMVTGAVQVGTQGDPLKLDGMGGWTMTVPKNKLANNKTFNVFANDTGANNNVVIINAKDVSVVAKSLIVAAP